MQAEVNGPVRPPNRELSQKYTGAILIVLVVLLPWLLEGVLGALASNSNDPRQWLPRGFHETDTYDWLQAHFGNDEITVVSWPGCTLTDDRAAELAQALVENPETAYFQRAFTGRQVFRQLVSPPINLSPSEAIRRLRGVLIGPDERTTCVILTVSPRGEVLDSGRAAEVTYFLGGAGEQGIDADFGDFFPGLPEGPVKVGDSWSYEGGIPGNSFNPETQIVMTSVNTLEGYETIDGMECAKITSTFTGELVTEGESSPGTAISGGPVEGSGVWYFAYEEGLLVKATRNVRARTEIAMMDPGSPLVPALEETKIEIGLVPKVGG